MNFDEFSQIAQEAFEGVPEAYREGVEGVTTVEAFDVRDPLGGGFLHEFRTLRRVEVRRQVGQTKCATPTFEVGLVLVEPMDDGLLFRPRRIPIQIAIARERRSASKIRGTRPG